MREPHNHAGLLTARTIQPIIPTKNATGQTKIEADDEKVKMYYTSPVPSDSIVQERTGVLPFVHHG